MILRNTTRLDTELLRKELYRAAKWMDVSLCGVYVQVNNRRKTRLRGKCWGARDIHRKKQGRISVSGYIKLYVGTTDTLLDVAAVFVHELSHLRDFREYTTKGLKIPYGKERRAQFFEQEYRRLMGRKR